MEFFNWKKRFLDPMVASMKFGWFTRVSHSKAGILSSKVKAVLHCEPPRAATPSSSSLWLTMERKLARLPEASSCTPLRGNQPRSCTVSQEISLADTYHHPLPVVFPVAFDLLCFQILSKSKRMIPLKEKAVTKTSKGLLLHLWVKALTVAFTFDCCFVFCSSGLSHRQLIFLTPVTWEFFTKRVTW